MLRVFGVSGYRVEGLVFWDCSLGFRIQLRRFKGFSVDTYIYIYIHTYIHIYIYRAFLREFSTEVMAIEEVALSQPRL